ncbi:MAG: cytochrome c553 [Cyclobacteriaceae bacterium]
MIISSKYINYYFPLLVLFIITSCGVKLPEEVQIAYDKLPAEIDFNIHIKPIISDRCFACHGPDEQTRQANLRFDNEEGFFAKGESGKHAFVAGNVDKSESISRILSDDPEYMMPSPKSNRTLDADEKAVIIKWIEQGAEWKEHWAYIPPEKRALPEAVDGWKSKNEIDLFIQKKLIKNELEPSPEADENQLFRRVTMELTGLPPTISEMESFMNDKSEIAYEKIVDRLLVSDAYAERMTLEWLDLARYADSHGFHADGERMMWPWRDWVIKAFKNNKPYDEFVSEQLAGDLMPNATKDQIIATAFNRNHPMTAEGGAVDEEFRVEYVANRTNTLGTAFLGLTVECARCHDHKFDPISQKEYYQLSAFFNNVRELGMTGDDGNYGPMFKLTDEVTDKRIADLDGYIAQLEKEHLTKKEELNELEDITANSKLKRVKPILHHSFEKLTKSGSTEFFDDRPNTIQENTDTISGISGLGRYFNHQTDKVVINKFGQFELTDPFSVSVWVKPEIVAGKTQVIIGNAGVKNNMWRGWDFYLDSTNNVAVRLISSLPHNYIHLKSKKAVKLNEWSNLIFSYDGSAKAGGIDLYLNGQKSEVAVIYDNLYKSILPTNTSRTRDYRGLLMGKSYRTFGGDNGIFKGAIDELAVFDRALFSSQVPKIYEQTKNGKRPFIYVGNTKNYRDGYTELLEKRKERLSLVDTIPELMVMKEMSKIRPTYLLKRGAYDAHDEQVEPGTPEKVLGMSDEFPKNRYGLTQWLFDKKNPLTARVAVNRYWQMIFGRGIVSTPGDFGSQGRLPSHPELLDWLAVEFMESGWDVKALIKLMVTSQTYRQSSKPTQDQMKKDDVNIFLARAPSYRWQAEFIRDIALASSGLLYGEVGGESAKPYQPDGLWIEKGNFSHFLLRYKRDEDQNQYRRSMYTFMRRTSIPPFMELFDAPSREVCIIKRERTNTPLQSLVLLNDPQFIEASRALAMRLKQEAGGSLKDKIEVGFQLVLSRPPSTQETEVFEALYEEEYAEFEKDKSIVKDYLSVGDFKSSDEYNPIEMAALSVLSNTLFNMDEAITKR